ncbi:MAG: transcription elongation factor GreA [candidate division WOR-3 bacterium]
MREEDRLYLTEEGYRRLEAELKHLTTVERHRIAEQFRESKEHGEFGEDSEFEELKSEQAYVEGRIQDLKMILQRATVVREEDVPVDHVGVGSRVLLEDVDTKERKEIRIVGAAEADPSNGLVSYLAPLGEALLDHRVGDVVEVKRPHGKACYKVLAISK